MIEAVNAIDEATALIASQKHRQLGDVNC